MCYVKEYWTCFESLVSQAFSVWALDTFLDYRAEMEDFYRVMLGYRVLSPQKHIFSKKIIARSSLSLTILINPPFLKNFQQNFEVFLCFTAKESLNQLPTTSVEQVCTWVSNHR
jgi:hypothetical protein